MTPAIAAAASLACLALMASIYYCNLLSGPKSWLRADILAMLLLSLLVGIFPAGAVGTVMVLIDTIAGLPQSLAISSLFLEMISIVALIGTVVLFRGLLRSIYGVVVEPTGVTPLVTGTANRMATASQGRASHRKAA